MGASKLGRGGKRLVFIDALGKVPASWAVPAGASGAAPLPLPGQAEAEVGDSSFAGQFADHLRQGDNLHFERLTRILLKKRVFGIQ